MERNATKFVDGLMIKIPTDKLKCRDLKILKNWEKYQNESTISVTEWEYTWRQ